LASIAKIVAIAISDPNCAVGPKRLRVNKAKQTVAARELPTHGRQHSMIARCIERRRRQAMRR
jgi:hypothetical protein